MSAAEPVVLLRVVHGSRLYGTARPDSDWDWYEVISKRGGANPWTGRRGVSRQSQVGSVDTVRKDVGTWLQEVALGVPQACEAAWADPSFAEVDLIRNLRLGLRVGTAGWSRHRRAMRNFASGYWAGGDGGEGYAMKRARHAVRLAWNLRELRRSGWYNPTASALEVAGYLRLAEALGPGDELWKTCDAIAMGETDR